MLDNQFPIAEQLFYRIRAMGKMGSQLYSKTVSVIVPSLSRQLSIYPNPVSDVLNIPAVNKVIHSVRISNITGKQLSCHSMLQPMAGVVKMNVTNLPKGVYLVEVIDDKAEIYQEKFVKE